MRDGRPTAIWSLVPGTRRRSVCGLLETIDRGRIFDTVEEAVAAYRRETGSESGQAADKGQGPS
jgi:hypothetical protein